MPMKRVLIRKRLAVYERIRRTCVLDPEATRNGYSSMSLQPPSICRSNFFVSFLYFYLLKIMCRRCLPQFVAQQFLAYFAVILISLSFCFVVFLNLCVHSVVFVGIWIWQHIGYAQKIDPVVSDQKVPPIHHGKEYFTWIILSHIKPSFQ